MSPPTSRLVAAFALSLALHGGLLFADLRKRPPEPPPRPALQALLRLPPKVELPPAERLLKNTLDEAINEKPTPEPTPPKAEKSPAKPKPTPRPVPKREIETAQRKLAEHKFYSPAAIEQGLEGEGILIIKLADDGTVIDASVAASSGHSLLDDDAIRAVYEMGRLIDDGPRERPFHFFFRLE